MKQLDSFKVYVILTEQYVQPQDSKKLVLMIDTKQMIYELKRKVEREYSELFPSEPPYVVAKLLDNEGYALSNNSYVKDVLKNGEKLTSK